MHVEVLGLSKMGYETLKFKFGRATSASKYVQPITKALLLQTLYFTKAFLFTIPFKR